MFTTAVITFIVLLIGEPIVRGLIRMFGLYAVVEEGSQDGPVPFAFEGAFIRKDEQFTCLKVTQGRSGPFIIIRSRTLNPGHRVMRDRVLLTQIIKQ